MTDFTGMMPMAGSDADRIFRSWLVGFGHALETGAVGSVVETLIADSWWRDLLALSWDFTTTHGAESIGAMLAGRLGEAQIFEVAPDDGVPAQLRTGAGRTWIEGFFEFRTTVATGRGVARLVVGDGGHWRGWTILTSAYELNGHEPALGRRRPLGPRHLYGRHAQENWLDRRIESSSYRTSDPQVVVIGAGQGGLAVAANLGLMGIDALLIDKGARIGDGWRTRYHSLVLHDPVWANHLPHLPFPRSWPVFMSKDKIADWFEFYASAMELNVWTSTELVASRYDDESQTWVLRLKTLGGERELRPKHVVLATGASGETYTPDIPGADRYRGEVYHSSRHRSGERMRGRRAVVIGACNSAHDIAQELYEAGARVTMVQRSSTYIMSQRNGIPVIFGGLYSEDGLPTEYADLLNSATPWPLVQEFAREQTVEIAERDRPLLDRLEAAGFKLNYGVDGGGLMSYAMRTAGGYYIDVGCSELIANREIAVKQGAGVAEFTPSGITLEDGTTLDADLVVFATGYSNMRETARRLFGDDVAERCEPVLGLDAGDEIRTLWRDSGQPGLWFMGGPLAWTRIYSRYLALQIVGVEAGYRPKRREARRAADAAWATVSL